MSTASSFAPSSRRASAARATAASTTRRATAPPARPSARSTATSSRSRTATSCSAGSSRSAPSRAPAPGAKITEVLQGLPGRPRRRPRAVPLPDPDPGVTVDGRQVNSSTSARAGSSGPARLGRGAQRPRRLHEVVPVPERAARHELDADARRGDAHRVHRAGGHRRRPRDVLQARPGRAPTRRSERSPTTSRSAGSCAGCTSGARASSSS